jgi:Ca-activated chloride channel family protein
MRKRYALLFYALTFFLFLTPASGKETVAGKVMIVLDASGSMWGEIRGEPKIVIARRVIHDLLKDWDSKIELGLAAYGHRRKADCKDIEVLVPIGSGNEQKVLAAVDALKPKGKTPLSDAVRIAADALKFTEDRATVILVSDGKETCEADPCRLGQELEDKGVDFTAHVIGFDVKKAEETGLRCLAANTGGLFATAKDAGGLKKALEKTVVEVKKKVAVPVPKKKVDAEPGVKLVATYVKGGPEFKGDINWHVLTPQKDLAGNRKKVANQHRGKSGHIFRNLSSGKYIFIAELSDHRFIQREYEIEVNAAEAAVHELALDIGTVRFDAFMKAGGQPFKGDLGWDVLDPKKDLAGKHKKLVNFWRKKSGHIFILPAGQWLIHGIMADHKHVGIQSKEIVVTPAGEELHEFVFNAGTVRFDALLKEGGQPYQGDLGWDVLELKKDLAGKHKKLVNFWRKKSGHIFILPAGQWLIQGVLADWKFIGTQKEITVVPAGEELHTFVFNAGTVRFDALLKEGGQPFTGDLGWDILAPKPDLAGKHKKLVNFWRKKSGSLFMLPAGEWLIHGLMADHKQNFTKGQITVQSGEEQISSFVFNAGTVKVDVTHEGADYPGEVGWDIYTGKPDLSGKRKKIVNAWRVRSGRLTMLPAGDYYLVALNPDKKDIKGEINFSVAAGEEKSVSVDLKNP